MVDEKILDKYADVLVNFALNNCKGIKKGDVVLLQVPECAKPMLVSLRRAVLRSGGNAIIEYLPDDMAREYYELASDEQLTFFPEHLLKGKVEQVDHAVAIIADTNKKELEGISPQKLMKRQQAFKPYFDWRDKKEAEKRFTWTLGLYGTEEMAREANISLDEYWQQIIDACFLIEEDPVAKWREVTNEIERVKHELDALAIQELHVTAPGTDLTVRIGENRKWLGASGRNIPSYEVFISPDWRGTEGTVTFTEPLYRYGNLIAGVQLTFKNGHVVNASAEKGEQVLKEMIAAKNADRIGEFSLTDARISRITRFMAETLYDENVGGEHGNMHLALGKAYKDAFPGDPGVISELEWEQMGYNDSVVHTDIVATTPRRVTARCGDGETRVIYENGRFTV